MNDPQIQAIFQHSHTVQLGSIILTELALIRAMPTFHLKVVQSEATCSDNLVSETFTKGDLSMLPCLILILQTQSYTSRSVSWQDC